MEKSIPHSSRDPAAARTIEVANHHPGLRLNRRALLAVIRRLDAEFRVAPADRRFLLREPVSADTSPVPPGELSLVFLTDPELAKLHGQFMHDPAVTDVITFEGDAAHGTAGEICVSVDTAAAYAREHDGDFSSELVLYVIHGWLHLAGYDDLKPARKRVMRRAEARALKLLEPHRRGTGSAFVMARRAIKT
ncbi:MAG: hypothetical protein JWM88_3253 [Verrucomicrobia bacterium]|nr:hypothetical protein [Verrucomicrobiota bacterium]